MAGHQEICLHTTNCVAGQKRSEVYQHDMVLLSRVVVELHVQLLHVCRCLAVAVRVEESGERQVDGRTQENVTCIAASIGDVSIIDARIFPLGCWFGEISHHLVLIHGAKEKYVTLVGVSRFSGMNGPRSGAGSGSLLCANYLERCLAGEFGICL